MLIAVLLINLKRYMLSFFPTMMFLLILFILVIFILYAILNPVIKEHAKHNKVYKKTLNLQNNNIS